MGRYQFVHSAMGKVHQRYQSPHVAVSGRVFQLDDGSAPGARGAARCVRPCGDFWHVRISDGLSTTCIVAPLELFRARELSPAGLATGIVGVGGMAFVLVASVVAVPPYSILATAVYFSRIPRTRWYLVRSHFG